MKRLYFLFLPLLLSASALADKVSLNEAHKTAQAFMPGEKFEVQKYAASTNRKSTEDFFYIFNKVDGNGFVLVSADDRTTAILGYSTNGRLDMSDIPDNVRYWLDSYAKQITALDKGVPAVRTAKTRAPINNIEPLIEAHWDQGKPYNLMCPDGDGKDYDSEDYDPENSSLSGCVATAVAQIMYYYQNPTTSTDIPSYSYTLYKTTDNGTEESEVTLQMLPATTFEWDKMRPVYRAKNGYTEEEALAVAKLMRYVGQANMMEYNIEDEGGSGTSIRNNMMQQCFGYSKKMHTLERNYYTTSQWEAMVYEELENKRPLPYGGFADAGGHQFIIDGYQDGLFHFNWGWGGDFDGYFVLSIADSDATDGAGGSGPFAFKYNQEAVFYFMPAGDDEADIPQMRSIVKNDIQPQKYTRDQEKEPFTDVTLTATYKVVYDYEATESYEAEVGWALYRDDQYVDCLGSTTRTISYAEHKGKNLTNELKGVTISAALPDGKYQLRQVFRQAGTDEDWTLMDNYGTHHLAAVISGNTLAIKGVGKNSQPGDTDGDGEITMSDVVGILSYLLGDAPEGFDEIAADINGDGEVTISDALIVTEMISQY